MAKLTEKGLLYFDRIQYILLIYNIKLVEALNRIYSINQCFSTSTNGYHAFSNYFLQQRESRSYRNSQDQNPSKVFLTLLSGVYSF